MTDFYEFRQGDLAVLCDTVCIVICRSHLKFGRLRYDVFGINADNNPAVYRGVDEMFLKRCIA